MPMMLTMVVQAAKITMTIYGAVILVLIFTGHTIQITP